MACFLMGYIQSIKDNGNSDISTEFQRWLQLEVNKKFGLHWTAFVYEELSDFNDEKAIEQLLKLISKYLSDVSTE